MAEKPIIGITMGDAAGIGPEIIAKAIGRSDIQHLCRLLVIGDSGVMKDAVRIAKVGPLKINPITDVKEAKFSPNLLDVLDLNNLNPALVKIGQINKESGRASVEYVLKAIELALKKKIQAITTAPINKTAIRRAGYKFQGHTELLAKYTKSKNFSMMFISDSLWVALVTTHIPLKDVPKKITKKKVLETIKNCHKICEKLQMKKPRIGVAGLNPHAGESGIFGKEEIKIIKPAIEEAKKSGLNATGPISPDAIFYLAKAGMFDCIVAMYHDQGLIPLKLLSFNKSVNLTAGISVIRTSVDHGTGFDIAGKGWANPESMVQAIKVAAMLAEHK